MAQSLTQSQTQEILEVFVDESETGSVLGTRSQSRKRSLVWKHFAQDTPTIVVCKYCNKSLAQGPGIGTTHLHRHLERACDKITQEVRAAFLADKNDDLFQSNSFVFDSQLTRDLLTLLFINAEIPFSIIDTRFWEPALKSLNPAYKSVGRQTLRNDCVEVFKRGTEALLKEFEEIDSRICFTSDVWTSSVHLGYLCLTAHYIDKDFIFHKKIVAFKQIPYPHTGVAVANMIEKILVDLKLDRKIFTLTLDNCSVNDSAMKNLEKLLWDRNSFGVEHMHMRCAAHILNLMVQDGMQVIQPALHRIREMMRHITSSGSRLQNFNTILKELKLNSKKGLTLDCPTRWNSTYEMVGEALVYKDALLRFGDEFSIETLSFDEWEEAKEVAQFLKVFLDVTKAFSHVRRPSSHTYVKEVWAIRELLLEDGYTLSSILRNLAIVMQKKFDKYWKEPNMILILACVFDPRCKLAYVNFSYKNAYGDDSNEKIERVQSTLKMFFEQYDNVVHNVNRTISSGSPQIEGRLLGKRKLQIKFSQYQSENPTLMTKKSELETYLAEPFETFEEEENFDVLKWWKVNSGLYPTLARMARDFLAVQVSSVASESAFSTAGRLTDNLRSSLSSETIEALICSKDWFGPNEGNFNLDQFRPFMRRSNFCEGDNQEGPGA